MSLRPQHVAAELLSKVTKTLGITALDQWYYVHHRIANRVIGARVLNKFGGTLASFLKYAYPQHQFDEEKLESRRNPEKDQKFIEVVIRQLFPNTEIHTKARKSVGIVNPETGAHLEIDFWIPSLKLGIEYQDKHHFEYQWYANETLEDYQKRDDIKKDIMPTLGYTLITIGYWWDKSIESVAATIRQHRPDLLPQYENISAQSIPSEPPKGYTVSTVIPGVAGLMSPFIPKGNDFNPINWYGGEKHDGIRGIYNHILRKMFSRSGNELSVLSSLLMDIPSILVEGEIVAGRGNYNKTSSVSLHTHHERVNWPMFRYVVFDIPNSELGNYTNRYSSIASELWSRTFIFAQSAFRVLLVSKEHMKMLVDAVISDAGEGVIAQQDSRYELGRAKGLAKIKVRRDDDAKVLRINELSCACKLTSGVTADISFCDKFDSRNLKVGDIVSYYHNGYTHSGLPKRGEIYKIRYDINWVQTSDKVYNIAKRRSIREAIGIKSLNTERTVMDRGHWNKPSNVRAYFDKFAQATGFDPLIGDKWRSVGINALRLAGGRGLLSAYGYNIKKALSCAYPELTFNKENFRNRASKGYWNKPTNIRSFFEEFARTSGFDPMVPENWYSVRTTNVKQAGGFSILDYYSFKEALSLAYPELKFIEERFGEYKRPTGHWNNKTNVRVFFDEFARAARFDPLVVENWYSVRTIQVQLSGGSGIFNYYSLKKALTSAYPELVFTKWKTT